eukprot:scaffold5138_cov74-Skeletonema_menzelii.AAC.4
MKCEKVESNVPDSDSRKTKKPRTTHPGGDTRGKADPMGSESDGVDLVADCLMLDCSCCKA